MLLSRWCSSFSSLHIIVSWAQLIYQNSTPFFLIISTEREPTSHRRPASHQRQCGRMMKLLIPVRPMRQIES
ncbi:hypothetical protein EV424DRAFT_1395956 [Suillus variegatus]|nr:hypothetical protein EV424DRAFT_1395956 [Suillus variegatus]